MNKLLLCSLKLAGLITHSQGHGFPKEESFKFFPVFLVAFTGKVYVSSLMSLIKAYGKYGKYLLNLSFGRVVSTLK